MSTPDSAQIRRAIEALGIPFDPEKLGSHALQDMTEQRRQTALLALLHGYVTAHLNNHLIAVDPLTADERYVVNVSAISEVTEGDTTSGMALAMFNVIQARDVIEEAGRNIGPGESPKAAITALLHAVLWLTEMWIAGMESPESFAIGTKKYGVVREAPFAQVIAEIMVAIRSIEALGGQRGPDDRA